MKSIMLAFTTQTFLLIPIIYSRALCAVLSCPCWGTINAIVCVRMVIARSTTACAGGCRHLASGRYSRIWSDRRNSCMCPLLQLVSYTTWSLQVMLGGLKLVKAQLKRRLRAAKAWTDDNVHKIFTEPCVIRTIKTKELLGQNVANKYCN
eukprot:3648640-Amphidinium_carterae.1